VAQTPFQTWVTYEVREEIDCNPGGTTTPLEDPLCLQETTRGFGTRIADASLVGGLSGFPGGVFSPTTGARIGGVSVSASSILSQVDWTGPAHGKFSIVLPDGAVQTGVLSGQLNLSLVRFQSLPLAPIAGQWAGTRGTLKAGGTFAGVFLLPFPCDLSLFGCYLEIDANGQPTGSFTPIQREETVFVPGFGPVPLIKLVVALSVR
jgi:hypothetical protein